MKLSRLREMLDRNGVPVALRGDADVTGVAHDSRHVQASDLFVALRGATSDGHGFVKAALTRGATALLVEHFDDDVAVPQLQTPNTRAVLGLVAHEVFGQPTEAVRVIGITGTNGKTTVSWLLSDALSLLGQPCGLLGTIEKRGPSFVEPSTFTTPEADEIARFARRITNLGARFLAMEVSSHALSLSRMVGTKVEVAAFTNLSQDHLDFHGDMASYFAAKASLFSSRDVGARVVCVDDSWGQQLAMLYPDSLTVSTAGPAGLSLDNIEYRPHGMQITVRYQGQLSGFRTSLMGTHNVQNLLVVAGILLKLGFDRDRVFAVFANLRSVPGRMEVVRLATPKLSDELDAPNSPLVVVDYAHTPDALSKAIAAIRGATRGRVWVVFGCGGDRDKSKRALMGRAVVDAADVAILTSDNPRSESPQSIVEDVEPGMVNFSRVSHRAVPGNSEYSVILDRKEAIEAAIFSASNTDVVLIAGKGHESYQEVLGVRRDFDDREVAKAALIDRQKRGGS